MPQVDFFIFPLQSYLFIIIFFFLYSYFSFEILPLIFKIFKVRKYIKNVYENKVNSFKIFFFLNIFEIFISKLGEKILELIMAKLQFRNFSIRLLYLQFLFEFLEVFNFFFFFFKSKFLKQKIIFLKKYC